MTRNDSADIPGYDSAHQNEKQMQSYINVPGNPLFSAIFSLNNCYPSRLTHKYRLCDWMVGMGTVAAEALIVSE